MLFHSFEFLIGFLPIVLAGYLVLAHFHLHRSALIWLTVASLVFYGWWNPPYLILIIGSILANYLLGRLVSPLPHERPGTRSGILFLGIAINLGTLGYFKYANFFVENLNPALGTHWNLEEIFLPLAISFFTFTQIAYLVDAYRGETKQYGLLEYSFFVTFFPHLIAGPIVLHREIMPQVEKDGAFRLAWENIQVGLAIFGVGFFKKLVLADGCGEYATPFFRAAATGATLSVSDTWIGVLAYTFQLYFDFSGYSDMAIGLSRLFGIQLPLNFASPYRATSIIEFWRRWHISLSRFLRNYLYIPLGGNRRGITLRYSNLLITMLIGGIWHGAGWTFLIWGALHGVYLIINHAFRNAAKFPFALPKILTNPLSWGVTMLAVIVGWVFFRSPNLETAGRILGVMFGLSPVDAEVSLVQLFKEGSEWFWILSMFAIVLLMPNTQSYFTEYEPGLDAQKTPKKFWQLRWNPTFLHGLIIGSLVFLGMRRLFLRAPSEFLYFNF